MIEICKLFGVSKQAYYKFDETAALTRRAREDFALQYIREVRMSDPGIGGLKLWYMYQAKFGIDRPMGRDCFCDLIDRNNLKVRLKVRKPRTTDSTHGLPTYPNLTKDLIPTASNQLWVSDITYITIIDDGTPCRFCFLSMILDAYTEEIVGWSVGATLDTRYPVMALKMALGRLSGEPPTNLIHHSDRGSQYASSKYVNLLMANNIRISMTESGDPKDNAQAERINNTMKNELLRGKVFHRIEEVISAVANAVDFYNNSRPHMSIGMSTPAQAANMTGDRDMKWRSFKFEAIKRKLQDEKQAECLSLDDHQGSPSGLRPPVNP